MNPGGELHRRATSPRVLCRSRLRAAKTNDVHFGRFGFVGPRQSAGARSGRDVATAGLVSAFRVGWVRSAGEPQRCGPFVPVLTKEFARVLSSLGAVPASQIACRAVLFTAPADPLRVLRVERNWRHR